MKNAVMPYAIIAIIGVVAVIIISVIGLNQQQNIADGGEGENTEQTEDGAAGETAGGDADSVFQANCAACHGADLSGGAGPALTTVGASYSVDEIKDIIQNGKGGMPAIPAVQGEEL